jgi:hypothetical protein
MKCQFCGKWMGSVEPVDMENPVDDYVHFCSWKCYTKTLDSDFAERLYGINSKQLEEVLNR